MSRPLYESELDRGNESQVAKVIEAKWKCLAKKLKPACEVDYALERSGRIIAMMEVKCRAYTYGRLDELGGLMLSAHKWQAARRWWENHGIGFVLAVGLTDGVYALSVHPDGGWPQKLPLVMGGRLDRGDAQDIEPCVLIPMNLFKLL
jgi:hypothetical protein